MIYLFVGGDLCLDVEVVHRVEMEFVIPKQGDVELEVGVVAQCEHPPKRILEHLVAQASLDFGDKHSAYTTILLCGGVVCGTNTA